MRGTFGLACLLIGGWLALFGLAALILRYGVVEVLCVELAAVTLAVIGAVLLIDQDLRECGHESDCEDVR